VNDEGWDFQLAEMLRSELVRLPWRMKRVRQQEQSIGNPRIFGTQHTRLPSAVRLSAHHDLLHSQIPEFLDGVAQTFAIASRFGRARWTVRAVLAKRQVATENGQAHVTEPFAEDNEHGRIAVAASTVGDHQAYSRRRDWLVKEPAYRRINGRVGELL
jgi:hypothetical protein